MLLLIIVIVRLTTNIPFNVLILNLSGKDQVTSTTSLSSEPIITSTSPVTTSTPPITTSTPPVQQQNKNDQVPSSKVARNQIEAPQKSNRYEEPEVKISNNTPSRRKEVTNEGYIAPQKTYSSNTPPRESAYNSRTDQAKDNSYSEQAKDNSYSEQTNVDASSDLTNGNSPYAYNRSSAYSQKSNTSKSNSSNPISSKSNKSKSVATPKYNSNSSRYFSQSEMNEFIRQYPNRSTYIHFVNFGIADNEMEDIRSQIIGMLNSNGYYEIDKNWFVYNGYTEIKEVHFGVNGNTAVNFYIPPIK